MDNYRITTPDVPDAFEGLDNSQSPYYNSIYHDYLKRDKNSNDELDIPNGRYSPISQDILRQKRSFRKTDPKRRSSIRESEQKPVLSMYATMPRSYRRPTTPSTGDSDDGTQDIFRVKPKVRPGLTLSPYLKRASNNFGLEDRDLRHRTLETKRSFDFNLEEQERKTMSKQLHRSVQLESNRSSSSTANYFTSPFSYTNERSRSQKRVSRSEAHLHNRSRTNSIPPNNTASVPKKSDSEASDSTVSDTTPKASPEPPKRITPPPEAEAVLLLDNENLPYLPPPPVPPPRTFQLHRERKGSAGNSPTRSAFKTQSAKMSIERAHSPHFQDSGKFFRTNKRSTGETDGEDHQNLTIRRRDYNYHVTSKNMEYVAQEVKQRLGVTIEGNFEDNIKDGILACQLVNLVSPDLIQIHFPERKKPLTTKQITLNIEKFLDGCRQVGVPTNMMCTAADLVTGDLAKVLKNFVYLLNSSSV